jgi:hypothetical protein
MSEAMKKELQEILEIEYRQSLDAQSEDAVKAEAALREGNHPDYFDLNINQSLPEACWGLEKWEEARHWYHQNARTMLAQRAWHAEHSGPDYPREATSDWLASTLIKAGDLQTGGEHLRRVLGYWQAQPDNSLVISRLGLHAAQAGLAELAKSAEAIIEARFQLQGGEGEEAEQARQQLHYEPAQVHLMLGRWAEFQTASEELANGARLVEGKPGLAFPTPLQEALVAASRGLSTLASIQAGTIEPQPGQKAARQAFEEAMLSFYNFSGQMDWNLYFMRLNTRFADELAAGQSLNPNPFADGWRAE